MKPSNRLLINLLPALGIFLLIFFFLGTGSIQEIQAKSAVESHEFSSVPDSFQETLLKENIQGIENQRKISPLVLLG
ncbi:hypothetical protein ACFL9U_12750, partial [Thermodesulfobacteriota bacterium]